jgi:hypothetical protein
VASVWALMPCAAAVCARNLVQRLLVLVAAWLEVEDRPRDPLTMTAGRVFADGSVELYVDSLSTRARRRLIA